MQISPSLTFEEAITLTRDILSQKENGQLNPDQGKNLISELVALHNGCRGFFVVYLCDDYSLDSVIISALKTSPVFVSELLTKNLAMSTATATIYQRNQEFEQAEQSKQVQQRTLKLIQAIDLPELSQQLRGLYHTLATGQGEWQQFLDRWHYDSEQRENIKEIIANFQG